MKKVTVYPLIAALTALSLLLTGCLCFNPGSGGGVSLPSIPGIGASSSGKHEPPNLPAVRPPGPPSPPPAGTRVSNTGTLTLGATVQMGSLPIDRGGKDHPMQAPGDPMFSAIISVPANAHPDTLTYKFSRAPITGNTFKNVTPVSPLITVDNGGGFAQDLIKVTVPVKLAPNQFAMGFLYDAATGKLEGMPLLKLDPNSVTVGTYHFSSFFISAIDSALLKPDIDSGFRPGIDDWQFTNYGSYLEPNGHCAGQSLTAMWYYVTQPDGKDLTLYGRYDRNGQKPATPDIWQDDSYGFRLASVVQHDFNWTAFETKFFLKMQGANPEVTWRAFAYAMRVTGEPQSLWMYSNSGGGHAMVVYRIKDGNLYIADPNYPGNNDRRIEYANGQFKPYNSGANAEEIAAGNGKAYENIGYVAKSACFDWRRIAARWQEFKAGTIGNGVFPDYQVIYVDDKGQRQELKEGTAVTNKILELETMASGVANGKNGWKVYRDGAEIKHVNWKYELKEGDNQLGITLWGEINGKDKYINFTYRKVIYLTNVVSSPRPTITAITGPAAMTGPFTYAVTVTGGTAPYTYEWAAMPGGQPFLTGSGPQYQTITTTRDKLRSNGAGLYLWVRVKDAKGVYAAWLDNLNREQTDFTYGVSPGGVAREPASFPYKAAK